MVVENRPGAGGVIGVEIAARAPADGSACCWVPSNLTVAPALDTGLPYDPVRDFAHRAGCAASARAGVMSRLNDGERNAGSSRMRASIRGIDLCFAATGIRFAMDREEFAGVTSMQVPYSGTAPALRDVLAGRVDLMIVDVPAIAPHASPVESV